MGLLPKLKIAQRLPLMLVGSALIVGAGVGLASYFIASTTVEEVSQRQLATTASAHARELATFLDGVAKDLIISASTDMAFAATRNPAETPKPEVVEGGADGPPETAESRIGATLRLQAEQRGYDDIYVFDAQGNLVHSGKTDAKLPSSFAASGLGRAFRAAAAMAAPGGVAFEDFAPSATPGEAAAAFVATPVFDPAAGTLAGVMAIRLPVRAITALMHRSADLGVTGESFVVGADYLMRNDSLFSETDDTLTTRYAHTMVDAAVAGTTASGITQDYRGIDMLATAVPLSFRGARWAVVTTIGEDEIHAPVLTMGKLMLVVGAGLLIAVGAAGLVFSRSVTKPITGLARTMGTLAEGDLAVEVDGTGRHDEVGEMARAVEVFRGNAQRVRDLTEEEHAGSERRRFERTQMMQALQMAFGEVVDAANSGDFSKRVDADFPDPELNAVAASVNNLVETVDRGLSETGTVLASLAQTDLTKRVQGTYKGAFERLKSDTNEVAERLSEIVAQLRDTSRALKSATGEILAGANDLSGRTTRQAATIQETSAAMEQLASTVQQNAQRAKEASGVAASVTHTAEEGGQVMRQATEAMERITTSSGKISNIIGLIDDIAFQTNLLALNASVEAARAGESGKGFAVVAVEVRRLAQSAAKASADVKLLIEQSGLEVRGGSKLVDEAATKLSVMLTAARTSNALMEGIARDSQEQAASIDEVNAAVRTMDEMTQHNAALVEETNASLEQAEAQASELDRIVEVFTLGDSDRAPVTASPPPPRPGVKGLQDKVRQAARSYLGSSSAAIEKEWSEF